MVVALFFHLAGLIVALGAVTVIDSMGFIARRSIPWTETTIKAHHITKPLIWIGTIPFIISWVWLYDGSFLAIVKSVLLGILVINGAFLSFYISPRLDKMKRKSLLPTTLQYKIVGSMVVSVLGWWSIVAITAIMLS